MAVFRVSNSAGLRDALSKARGGDTILLAGGNYGHLELDGRKASQRYVDYSGEVKIASANPRDPATFSKMNIVKAANVTLEGLRFDDTGGNGPKPFVINQSRKIAIVDSVFEGTVKNGYGAGNGLWAKNLDGFRLKNTVIDTFDKGTMFFSIRGLEVEGNTYRGIAFDAIYLEGVRGGKVLANRVDMKARSNDKHQDMIQLGHNGPLGASSDIEIRGNVLFSHDAKTHGIFMGNMTGRNGGDRGDYYKNIVIDGNTIVAGHLLGIHVGEADGVKIRNNKVLWNGEGPGKTINIPIIEVTKSASDVVITGNTTHAVRGEFGRDWTVSGNRIVDKSQGPELAGGRSAAQSRTERTEVAGPLPDPADTGRGGTTDARDIRASGADPDTFRFKGGDVAGMTRSTVTGLDFAAGDRMVFIHYDRGTFLDVPGGNIVWNNKEKTYVVIDDWLDIHEIAAASPRVTARVQGQDAVMRIEQASGVHEVVLAGQARAFQQSNDPDLF